MYTDMYVHRHIHKNTDMSTVPAEIPAELWHTQLCPDVYAAMPTHSYAVDPRKPHT